MKLIFFLPALHGGGAERALLTVAEHLSMRGHDVEVLTAEPSGSLLRDVPTHVRVASLRRRRIRASVLPLARHLREQRPDCVLATLTHAAAATLLAAALSRTGVPVVVRYANTPMRRPRARHLLRHLRWRAARRLQRRAAAIIAPSEGVAAGIRRVFDADSEIAVVPNPIVDESFGCRSQRRPDHPWFREGEPPVVLGVGRLHRQKGFDVLVRAVGELRSAGGDVRLMLLGDGGERDELIHLARSIGLVDGRDIQLPGFVDDPIPYMAHCGVFVLSSRFEGLPAVLIQALAAGARLVATDCRSGPREVLADGEFGRLVPVDDVGALADAIAESLAEPPPSRPASASERYAVTTSVEAYERLLMGVARR